MGTMTGQDIIDRAQIVLQDQAGVYWPGATELLLWLNDGQREVVIYKPTALVKNVAVKLQAGTKQTLPTDGLNLMDVPRNMGTDGQTPGSVVRIISREVLDAVDPDWHASAPSTSVAHYLYASNDPLHLYVYPPQPASNQGYVEMVYGARPQDLPTLADTIELDDVFAGVLVDYVLFRALSKDSEVADANRAQMHQQAYLTALTGKMKGEASSNPNTSAPAHPARNGAGG